MVKEKWYEKNPNFDQNKKKIEKQKETKAVYRGFYINPLP